MQFIDVSGIAGAYNWTFGDGGTSTEQNPVHTYTTTGVFNVTFQIIDAAGVIYNDNKTGFVFSTKNGLPVAFDGHSDEFDNEDSILLYNGTHPTAAFWGIGTYNGHSVMNYTGYLNSEYDGAAIFYAPPRNGSSELNYKFPLASQYSWNLLWNVNFDSRPDGQWMNLLWQVNGSNTNVGGYNTLYPPELAHAVNATFSEFSADIMWSDRFGGTKDMVWFRSKPGLRARSTGWTTPIEINRYYNFTVVSYPPDSWDAYIDYENYDSGVFTSDGTYNQYGFAGIDVENNVAGLSDVPCSAENLSMMKIDNWSFNYIDAPGAAFTYTLTSSGPWWASTPTQDTVQFTDASDTGFYATGWYWEFGDGTTSTEQNPVHKFSTPGDHLVNFRVETSEGFDWELNGSVTTTETTSPWTNSDLTTEMIENTIVMGMYVFVLGVSVAFVATLILNRGW